MVQSISEYHTGKDGLKGATISQQAESGTSGDLFDLLVIGGGINGVGIARDAAGRGLSVLLCERDDLGGATSSASSKLLHGGLRYLEQFQFRMVRHALAEREVLLESAPHIIAPMRFVLPHNPSIRRYWVIRLGVFLYDRLARRATLEGSRALDFRPGRDSSPLKDDFERGFEYSDCWVDDARLVLLTAMDARTRGATILTRTACTAADWDEDHWDIRLLDTINDTVNEIQARVVVNAAGPWAESVAREILGVETDIESRLVKGSHIVVPKLFDDERAFILQNDDRRVVFVLPFEEDFTLIGTTDIPYDGDPSQVDIDDDEIEYLCGVASSHFKKQVTFKDVVWSFSGVRPLYNDGSTSVSAISRDYLLEEHSLAGRSEIQAVTVWGGKLTGFRLLAEDVLKRFERQFPVMGGPWTANATLPGGNLLPRGIDRFIGMLTQVYDWMPPDLARAWARRYGSMVHTVAGNGSALDDLGQEICPKLYAREVEYLVRHEWAHTSEDILWRRTKLGLHASQEDVDRLSAFIIELDDKNRWTE